MVCERERVCVCVCDLYGDNPSRSLGRVLSMDFTFGFVFYFCGRNKNILTIALHQASNVKVFFSVLIVLGYS